MARRQTSPAGVGVRRVGDDRFTRSEGGAEQGLEVVEFQARGFVLFVKSPRLLVPGDVRDRVSLEVGLALAIAEHFGRKAVFTVRKAQYQLQKGVESFRRVYLDLADVTRLQLAHSREQVAGTPQSSLRRQPRRQLLTEFLSGPPQFELRHHLTGQPIEPVSLFGRELARRAINDAERSEVIAVRGGEERPCVEADAGFPGHQRIIAKAFVLQGIGDFEQPRPLDGVLAKGNVPGRLSDLETHLALEPLPPLIQQRDQRDGRLANLRGELREIIKIHLLRRVQHGIAFERGETARLVQRCR